SGSIAHGVTSTPARATTATATKARRSTGASTRRASERSSTRFGRSPAWGNAEGLEENPSPRPPPRSGEGEPKVLLPLSVSADSYTWGGGCEGDGESGGVTAVAAVPSCGAR